MPVEKFEIFEASFTDFEWDEAKRSNNINKHEIDFVYAVEIFDNPFVRAQSDRRNETRYLAIGVLHDKEIAVIYQERGTVCRIISARRARRSERAANHALLPRRD